MFNLETFYIQLQLGQFKSKTNQLKMAICINYIPNPTQGQKNQKKNLHI
jgi:hypothetical protein